MVGGVGGEDHSGVGDDLLHGRAQLLWHLVEQVDRVGDPEYEQVRVEGDPVIEPVQVEAEVAEAPDLEWARKKDSADVELLRCCGHHDLSPGWLLSPTE